MPDLPDVLTVEEAAAALRIGRTAAYQLARRYLATDGAEGMPARRVGRQLRIPRDLLQSWIGTTLHAPTPPPDHESQHQQQLTSQPTQNQTQLKLITNP
jgi:excisionase family DNA binding protein